LLFSFVAAIRSESLNVSIENQPLADDVSFTDITKMMSLGSYSNHFPQLSHLIRIGISNRSATAIR
jgi:hypothetical protein